MSQPPVWAVWQRRKRRAAHLWKPAPLGAHLAVAACDLPAAGALVYRTDLSATTYITPKCLRCLRETLDTPV